MKQLHMESIKIAELVQRTGMSEDAARHYLMENWWSVEDALQAYDEDAAVSQIGSLLDDEF